MTYRKFLVALRKTNRTWILNGIVQALRNGCQCPITEVAKADGLAAVDSAGCWARASSHLRIRGKTLTRILWASDNDPAHDPATRRDLLLACGIREQKAKEQ